MKHDQPEIIVVGSLHLDIVVRAKTRPRADETISGTDWDMRSGGKGGNQAIQAALQGAKTMMISRVGTDSFGDALLSRLGHAGVDTRYVRTDTTTSSGMGIALVDEAGVPGGVTVSGANRNIDASDISGARQAFESAKLLLLQQEINQDTNIEAARIAHSHGVTVILNAAPALDLPPDLEALVDILVVNEVEAAMLSGIDINGFEDARSAATALSLRFPVVLVTLGQNGVYLQERDDQGVHVPSFDVQVRDTLGAGDSFIGGLASRLARGADLKEAVEHATAIGALVVSGQQDRTTDLQQVREFMAAQPTRGGSWT